MNRHQPADVGELFVRAVFGNGNDSRADRFVLQFARHRRHALLVDLAVVRVLVAQLLVPQLECFELSNPLDDIADILGKCRIPGGVRQLQCGRASH